MATAPAPTDQRNGVKPIAFFLQEAGGLNEPVVLHVRPEDLTITEPSRVAVHQTLGRSSGSSPAGWVDNFGAGLPSITINGNTGWRVNPGSGLDGVGAFEALNQMVAKDYHEKKQRAVNIGLDPAEVRLLYVDALNNISWTVVPTNFVLRRSKSSPLLYRYNISLQAISTSVDNAEAQPPPTASKTAGITALRLAAVDLAAIPHDPSLDGVLGFLSDVMTFVRDAGPAASEVTNAAATLAFNLAQAALNAHRVMMQTASLPGDAAKNALLLSATLNEIACLFQNALRPRPVYEQYSGLLGASNCSSTTGGKPPSDFADQNVFSQMFEGVQTGFAMTGAAVAAVDTLQKMDGVLAPLPVADVRDLLGIVSGGILS